MRTKTGHGKDESDNAPAPDGTEKDKEISCVWVEVFQRHQNTVVLKWRAWLKPDDMPSKVRREFEDSCTHREEQKEAAAEFKEEMEEKSKGRSDSQPQQLDAAQNAANNLEFEEMKAKVDKDEDDMAAARFSYFAEHGTGDDIDAFFMNHATGTFGDIKAVGDIYCTSLISDLVFIIVEDYDAEQDFGHE